MKILIIEDEKDLREVMTRSLEKERFVVETAADYSTALHKINDYDYDCILLDIMLPGGSGLSILEELKKLKKRESVIIVSAKDSIEDKVTGLDLGADDYLAKPFHLAELHARVKSVIRRHQTDGNTEIEIENLTVRPDDHTVFINGEELKLNRKEFDLLYYFVIAATDYIVTACDYIIAACDFIISGSDYRIIACPVRFLCLNTVLFSGVILSNGIDPFFYVG